MKISITVGLYPHMPIQLARGLTGQLFWCQRVKNFAGHGNSSWLLWARAQGAGDLPNTPPKSKGLIYRAPKYSVLYWWTQWPKLLASHNSGATVPKPPHARGHNMWSWPARRKKKKFFCANMIYMEGATWYMFLCVSTASGRIGQLGRPISPILKWIFCKVIF